MTDELYSHADTCPGKPDCMHTCENCGDSIDRDELIRLGMDLEKGWCAECMNWECSGCGAYVDPDRGRCSRCLELG